MLIKTSERCRNRVRPVGAQTDEPSGDPDRRTFLRQSGLAARALAALGTFPLGGVREAEAGPPAQPGATVTTRNNVCTHCSVGCSVIAKVANGVPTRITARSSSVRSLQGLNPHGHGEFGAVAGCAERDTHGVGRCLIDREGIAADDGETIAQHVRHEIGAIPLARQ